MIQLAGQWKVNLETDNGVQAGDITLPGILQAQGYGNQVSNSTEWISGLYDPFWYEQEEYKVEQEDGCQVPFLSQPPLHFVGKAFYEREIEILEETKEEWILRIELTRWRTHLWIDDEYKGEDCSLCAAHEIVCGQLTAGKHKLRICVDNSMQYPYRPDGHGVSDALCATWNGLVGEIVLLTQSEWEARKQEKKNYAAEHPISIEARDGKFMVNGSPWYFRGTHFGGDYPLTGCPSTDKSWWLAKMRIIQAWGLNAIRCHSYCPPEAAFQAADEAGILILVECGMWNHFEENIPMLDVLRQETERILNEFGHHPSFAFFSPSNEPGGKWHQPLRRWVTETREYDRQLGYEGRRIYTAESGWHYEVPPSEITGTDFIYFHRSGYGPFIGGSIRNPIGWRGKDYSPSLPGVRKPVICHELGQWCAYPDFNVIEKFTGYMKPGNFKVFREQAKKQGVLAFAEKMAYCSGRNQVRLYKEELEANFRTREISGFELLDLHDYLGQGTALVGFLDAFWEEKGYTKPEEFRAFCGDTVLLARFPSYVWKNTDRLSLPIEVCHFGKADLRQADVHWKMYQNSDDSVKIYKCGSIHRDEIKTGENTSLGVIELDFADVAESSCLRFEMSLGEICNHWNLTVFCNKAKNKETDVSETPLRKVLYTKSWTEAKTGLALGKSVVYTPWLSDLDYECPPLSVRNVFWNSQMGPTWGRSLGLVVQEAHPIFKSFPTEESGGWQWEDILNQARGFHMKDFEQMTPIVRAIDDWNRSLPLGLLFEARVGKGKLLVVSANLEGEFDKRPAAYTLKQAILQYAASEEFAPETELSENMVEDKLFPALRMEQMGADCIYDEDAEVKGGEAIFLANPSRSVRMEKDNFLVYFIITLPKAVGAEGFLYVPEQRDRGHEGFLKEYVIEYLDAKGCWQKAAEGILKNTSLSQKIQFEGKITADHWRFTVYSCYGCVEKTVWKEKREGWMKEKKPLRAVLQFGGIYIICKDGEAATEHSDRIFWGAQQKSATKEIEA